MPNFGSSGIDFANHRLNGAATFFDQPDPALLPYGHFEAVSGGDSGVNQYRFVPNADSGITDQGYIRGPNGENLAQVDPEQNPYIINSGSVTNDSRFGSVTNVNNLRSTSDMWDTALPMLVAAGILGPTMLSPGFFSAGGAGLGATATAGASSEVALPGMLSNFATPSVGSLNLSGLSSVMSQLGLSSGGSSFLSALNTGRQAFSGANTISRLLGGNAGKSGTKTGGSMGIGDILQLLGGDLGSLIGLGRSSGLWGNGIGTPGGAIDVGNRAADRADPWGANGRRDAFANALTPDAVNKLLNPDAASIANDPAYQFQLKEGMNAINVGDAAQGTLNSGNRLYELQKYGQGLASDFAQRQFQNNTTRLNALGNLAGVNSSNPAAAGASLVGAFEGATSLQAKGLNGLFNRPGSVGNNGIGSILQLLGSGANGIGDLLGSLFSGGGLDPSGGGNEIDWSQLLGSTNISNNLFPGGDAGGGLDIWDALAGP